MSFYDSVLGFFLKMFSGVFEEVKKFVRAQIELLEGEALEKLADPMLLYKRLNIDKVVIDWLTKHDRSPNSEKLDFVPFVPEYIEKKAVLMIVRRVFIEACKHIVKELQDEEQAEKEKEIPSDVALAEQKLPLKGSKKRHR